jgi:hypothetical protein
MKHTEHDQLLNDVLQREELSAFRQASLERTLASIRRQRQQRRIVRACALACLPLLVTLGIVLLGPMSQPPLKPTDAPRPTETARVKFITDEELFALFPGRPMALIGKPGHQQLVFLDQPAATEQP